jgi:hypothetical protein
MKKIFTLILFVAVFGIMANAQTPKSEAAWAAKAPVADGYIDDVDDPWDADGWIELGLTAASSSTSAMTAQFNLMHDADNIYLAVKVQDDTPNNDAAAIPNSYERDCFEAFFSMDTTSTATGAYAVGCWQLRTQREAAEGSYVDGNAHANTWNVSSMTGGEGFEFGVENGSSEWSAEMVYPKAILAEGAAFDDEYIKFELAVADNTGAGRTQQQFWNNNSDQQWQDTRTFALVKLGEATGVNNVETVTGSAFVQNNTLKVRNVNGVVNVYDLRGAVVRTATVNGNASIDVSDLKSGMYVVKGNNLSAKVVK